MRVSEYIRALQCLLEQHGDLEVEKWMPSSGRIAARPPTLAYRMIAQDGPRGGSTAAREGIQSFWHTSDHPRLKGDKVFRV